MAIETSRLAFCGFPRDVTASLQRALAGSRSVAGSPQLPDDHVLARRLYDLPGNRQQPVDLHDRRNLREEALEEPDTAAGHAGDGRQRLGVGVIGAKVKPSSVHSWATTNRSSASPSGR